MKKYYFLDNKKIFNIILPILILSIFLPHSIGYLGFGYMAMTFVLLFCARAYKITFYFAFFIFFVIALYIPVGLDFGRIKLGYIVSAMQTNLSEMFEFVEGIGTLNIIILIVCIASLFIYLFNGRKGIEKSSKKIRFIYLIIFIILSINSYPKRELFKGYEYYKEAKKGLSQIKEQSKIKDDFVITKNNLRYKNIVIVVGESVNAEYLSVYGYPLHTTPWLEEANGVFVKGYVSAAAHTATSLPRTLAMSDGLNIWIQNNIVTLLNKVDLDTYWVSNQGFVSQYDTPATIIGSRAKHNIFLNKEDYFSGDTDDFEMLDILESIIDDQGGDKAIFLHMMGSHPNPCDRLQGFQINFDVDGIESLNCYLATLQKLDVFLHKTVQVLESKDESYVLIYFSDHGMNVDGTQRAVKHSDDYKQGYKVPLFIFTNHDKNHNILDISLSAFDFLSILEDIIGIDSEQIPAKSLKEASRKNIEVYDGKMVLFDNLKDNVIYY